jgi:hypothetical protein
MRCRFLAAKKERERFKRFGFAFGRKLSTHFRQRAFQDNTGPPSVEHLIWRSSMKCTQMVQLFGSQFVC